MIALSNSEVFKVVSGGTPSSSNEAYWNGNINWATLKDLPANESISIIKSTVRKITKEGLKKSSAKLLPINSVLVSTRATIGRIAINKVECSTNQGFKNIIINDFNKANQYYVALMMTNLIDKMNSMATGGTFKELSTSSFKTLKIPLPPLSIQKEIVAEIEGYQKEIEEFEIKIEERKQKIKDRIAKVWGTSASSVTPDKKEKEQTLSNPAEHNRSIAAEPEVKYKKGNKITGIADEE